MPKKQIATALIALATGAGVTLTATDSTVTTIGELVARQEAFMRTDSKFKFQRGANYEVHEYMTPTGDKGFQIIYDTPDATFSLATGPEKEDRTWIHSHMSVATTTP